mgnify:CR=1 FL=1
MALKEKLEALIKDVDSGIVNPEFDLEQISGDKVAGFVISDSFKGKSQIERQNMIWDYLDENLDKTEILRIVSLLTMTPDEFEND